MRGNFRSDVQKAYRIICERGMIDDGELQYILSLSHGPYYRVRKAILAMFPDVVHENGYFKLKSQEDRSVSKDMPIDFWGSIEPDKSGAKG